MLPSSECLTPKKDNKMKMRDKIRKDHRIEKPGKNFFCIDKSKVHHTSLDFLGLLDPN